MKLLLINVFVLTLVSIVVFIIRRLDFFILDQIFILLTWILSNQIISEIRKKIK